MNNTLIYKQLKNAQKTTTIKQCKKSKNNEVFKGSTEFFETYSEGSVAVPSGYFYSFYKEFKRLWEDNDIPAHSGTIKNNGTFRDELNRRITTFWTFCKIPSKSDIYELNSYDNLLFI